MGGRGGRIGGWRLRGCLELGVGYIYIYIYGFREADEMPFPVTRSHDEIPGAQ